MSSEPIDAETADDGVLTPEELELRADDDLVDELGENRYVIRSGSPTPGGVESGPEALPVIDDRLGSKDRNLTHLEPDVFERDGHDSVRANVECEHDRAHAHDTIPLESAPEPHGVDVTLKTDGELATFHTTSYDVRDVFAELLTWYATQLDEDLSPSQALQVMLATTDLDV